MGVDHGQVNKSLYFMPGYEDTEEIEKILKRVFKAWLDIEHFDLIEDVGAGPLEDE